MWDAETEEREREGERKKRYKWCMRQKKWARGMGNPMPTGVSSRKGSHIPFRAFYRC